MAYICSILTTRGAVIESIALEMCTTCVLSQVMQDVVARIVHDLVLVRIDFVLEMDPLTSSAAMVDRRKRPCLGGCGLTTRPDLAPSPTRKTNVTLSLTRFGQRAHLNIGPS